MSSRPMKHLPVMLNLKTILKLYQRRFSDIRLRHFVDVNVITIPEKSPKTPVGQTHPRWRTGFGVLTVGRGLFRIVVV